ncbi:MAG TPA: tetratricopeptide repeat protein [Chitinophagaceae bacterium]|nr:tetratricopeptide repeat protein [Chitinophagaceae bacterium]
MKKTTFTILVSGMLIATGLKAQTVQEGINHLYADRFKSAIGVFEKILATNPNNTDAIYWMGQTYLDNDENAKARDLYAKALLSSNNAPIILVGVGHVELHDNKLSDAKQHFEMALTSTRTKKGDDPMILTLIGRANVDAKAGDLPYAIEKLEAAVLRDPKNPETYLQLGNAYKKARPGEGGGKAFENYKKALEVNPNFPVADMRLAKLFESQKNWEFFLQYLNDAIALDPKFAPAYYELFYYYFFREKYPEAEAQLQKYIAAADDVIQNEYLYAQLCFGNKNYDCAITKAMNVYTTMGASTKPKVYKLIAYADYEKGNYADALKFINLYFGKAKTDSLISKDFDIKARIMTKMGGDPNEIYATYIQGAALDTVLANKIDFMNAGAAFFASGEDSVRRTKEGELRLEVIKLRPTPSERNYFDAGFAFYKANNLDRSDSVFAVLVQKWPESIPGWQLRYNIGRLKDTSMTGGLAIPPGLRYLELMQKDTAKNKRNIIGVASYLAQYYANITKDRDNAIKYLEIMVMLDPTNEVFKKYLEDMKKPPNPKTNPKGNGSQPKPSPRPELKNSTNSKVFNRP